MTAVDWVPLYLQPAVPTAVSVPPLLRTPAVIQGSDTAQTASNAIGFFTQVANASEQAGMGLCVVLFTTEGDSQDGQELLATIHTGEFGVVFTMPHAVTKGGRRHHLLLCREPARLSLSHVLAAAYQKPPGMK